MGDMSDTYKTESQEAATKRHAQAVAAFRAKLGQRQALAQHEMNREDRRAALRKDAK